MSQKQSKEVTTEEILEKGEKATVIFQNEDGSRNFTFNVSFLETSSEEDSVGQLVSKMEINPPVSITDEQEIENHFKLYGKLAMLFQNVLEKA